MKDTLLQSHAPYCVKNLGDGRVILLNRKYKPLGVTSVDWIEYESHPTAVRAQLTPGAAKKISWAGKTPDANGFVWLYDDGCSPWQSADAMQAYLDRLAVLMSQTLG